MATTDRRRNLPGTTLARWVIAALLTVTMVVPAHATLIELVLDVPSGFDLSLNGAPAAPSGHVTVRGILDNTLPEFRSGGSDYGYFVVNEMYFSASNFGIVDQLVVTSHDPRTLASSLQIAPDFFRLHFNGGGGSGVGLSGGTLPTDLMSDVNDLSTLPIGTHASFSYAYGVNDSPRTGMLLTLASGDTLDGVGGSGVFSAGGTLSVNAFSEVPVPAALWLFASGLLGLFGIRRKLN